MYAFKKYEKYQTNRKVQFMLFMKKPWEIPFIVFCDLLIFIYFRYFVFASF